MSAEQHAALSQLGELSVVLIAGQRTGEARYSSPHTTLAKLGPISEKSKLVMLERSVTYVGPF